MGVWENQLLGALHRRECGFTFVYLSAGFTAGMMRGQGHVFPLEAYLCAAPFSFESSLAALDNRHLRMLRNEEKPKDDVKFANKMTLDYLADVYGGAKAGLKKGATLTALGYAVGLGVGYLSK